MERLGERFDWSQSIFDREIRRAAALYLELHVNSVETVSSGRAAWVISKQSANVLIVLTVRTLSYCPICKGSGEIDGKLCPACLGSGEQGPNWHKPMPPDQW
jgi:hypothetical protein